MPIDQKKLALIHIIKKELKLDDAAYRKILMEAAGVTTAKDLDQDKFKKLMNYFVRSKHYRLNPHGLTIKQKLYIQYLYQRIPWDEEHFNRFIRKYYKKDQIRTLTRAEATKVIESLKNIYKHEHS